MYISLRYWTVPLRYHYYNKRYSANQASFRAMLCVFMPTDSQASPFSASPNALEAFVYIE
jgi:hypothetical protein